MDIYSKQQKWKFGLLAFAIIIGFSSLFITNKLVKELKNEERKKIELWAHATKHLVSITGQGDYSLAIKVISENSNIPVILVDACDSILEYRNFNAQTKLDSLSSISKDMLDQAKKDSDKLIIDMNDKFHKSAENKKKIAENKIFQMKEAALKEIKNTSVKIAIDSVKKIMTTSVDKSKLDNLFDKNLEEVKTSLKKINS